MSPWNVCKSIYWNKMSFPGYNQRKDACHINWLAGGSSLPIWLGSRDIPNNCCPCWQIFTGKIIFVFCLWTTIQNDQHCWAEIDSDPWFRGLIYICLILFYSVLAVASWWLVHIFYWHLKSSWFTTQVFSWNSFGRYLHFVVLIHDKCSGGAQR